MMIIGILSDTHGDVRRTAKAINALKSHAPQHILHCGDIGSQDVMTELAAGLGDPEIPVTCVYGNVDGHGNDIMSYWPHVQIMGRFAELELDEKRIAVIHGDDFRRLDAAITSGRYDFIFTGHTHERSDDLHNRTRVINPGAIHRAREPGCATLNLITGWLDFIDIK
jgi:hypothetical protein